MADVGFALDRHHYRMTKCDWDLWHVNSMAMIVGSTWATKPEVDDPSDWVELPLSALVPGDIVAWPTMLHLDVSRLWRHRYLRLE